MRAKTGFYISALIIFFILSALFFYQPARAAVDPYLNITNNNLYFFESLNNLDFIDNIERDFSEEGLSQLEDLASRYDVGSPDDSVVDELSGIESLGLQNNLNVNSGYRDDIFYFDLFPGITLEADYDYREDKYNIGINKNMGLEYQLDSDTILTANIDGRDYLVVENDPVLLSEMGLTDLDTGGALGISHQASSHFLISADFMQRDLLQREGGYQTSLGLEYFEDAGQIRASYLIDRENQKRESVTGMEVGYQDFVTLSASYKVFNPDIFSRFEDSTSWDLGLDLNINNISSLSIGYQQFNESVGIQESEGENGSSRSNIEASFQINF